MVLTDWRPVDATWLAAANVCAALCHTAVACILARRLGGLGATAGRRRPVWETAVIGLFWASGAVMHCLSGLGAFDPARWVLVLRMAVMVVVVWAWWRLTGWVLAVVASERAARQAKHDALDALNAQHLAALALVEELKAERAQAKADDDRAGGRDVWTAAKHATLDDLLTRVGRVAAVGNGGRNGG